MVKKYTLWIIISIIFSIITELKADISFDYSGYIYDQPSLQFVPKSVDLFDESQITDNFFLTNLTRVRIRPVLKLDENTRVEMHYEILGLASKVPLLGLIETGGSNRQLLNLSNTFISDDNFTARQNIDRLYIKHIFTWGETVLGRQRISWGVGRVWQPTDLFNPINPANFSKIEKDGADALSTKFYIGDFTDLELVANFRQNIEDFNYGGRFRTNYSKYDLSVMTGYFDRNVIIGGDFAGNLEGAGTRGEFIYKFHHNTSDSNFIRLLFGIDYQFTKDLYGLAEYQFNGEGSTDTTKYDFAKIITGESLNLARNYLTVSFTYQAHPLVSIGANVMQNLDDLSGFLGGKMDYSATENISIALNAAYFYGKIKSEYSYFPSSIYLTGQYFF